MRPCTQCQRNPIDPARQSHNGPSTSHNGPSRHQLFLVEHLEGELSFWIDERYATLDRLLKPFRQPRREPTIWNGSA
jgi:hypothetical protein